MKASHQYLILDPLAFITNPNRLSIESIILSIFSEGNFIIILLTLPENCSKDSLCIYLDIVSFFSSILIRWKKFSMEFRSGLRGAIAKIIAPISFKVPRATAEFWLASPSWRKRFITTLAYWLNAERKSYLAILANFGSLIRPWFCVYITAPWLPWSGPFGFLPFSLSLYNPPWVLQISFYNL